MTGELTEEQMLALMERFRLAYAAQNRDELLATTTDDFTWHTHRFASEADQPEGSLRTGVDGLLAELAWRGEHWSEVRYRDIEERSAGDMLVQTFHISGVEDGQPFDCRVVDLYRVSGGRIRHKDTYWKQPGPADAGPAGGR